MRRVICLALLLSSAPVLADTYTTLAPAGTAPTQRLGHSAVLDASGNRMIVFAGGQVDFVAGTFSFDNNTYALSLTPGSESWSQLTLANPPTARGFHTAVYDAPNDRMLVFSGLVTGPSITNDVWSLSLAVGSEAWTQLSPNFAIVALPRFGSSAVYTNKQMTVYGGYGIGGSGLTPYQDTLVLDFNASNQGSWALLPVAGGPASGGHQLAIDTAATPDRLLMFGVGDPLNLTAPTFSNDVWVRDFPLATNSWTKLSPPAPLPSARTGFCQVYDVTTNPALPRWLILGGGSVDPTTQSTSDPGDSYVFEATKGAENWVALVPSNNTARTGLWTTVHDTSAQRLVTFGGLNGYGFSNDATELTLASNYDPKLVSCTPNKGSGGQVLNVNLVGTGTAWTVASSANFGPEIRVNALTVTSATTATANISIMSAAIPGPRNVGVITGGQTDSAIGPFTVENANRNVLVGEGLDVSNPNQVRVFLADGTQQADFLAYGAGKYGTNVAAGDVTGDGTDEILTGPGPGAVFGPQVRGFDRAGGGMGKVSYYAYGTLKYGVNAGSGDTDRDGYDEILSGAGAGAVFGPHVRGWNFDNAAITSIAKINFFAYSTLKWGVKVVGGDLDFDGYDEILTAPGPGPVFSSQIRGFNVDAGTAAGIGKVNFVAFSGTSYGANVSSGDVDGDGYGEILAAKGPNVAYDAQVLGWNYDGATLSSVAGLDFPAFAGALYGARVGAGSVTLAPGEEILTSPGPDPAQTSQVAVRGYNPRLAATTPLGTPFPAFGTQMYGANVVSGGFGF